MSTSDDEAPRPPPADETVSLLNTVSKRIKAANRFNFKDYGSLSRKASSWSETAAMGLSHWLDDFKGITPGRRIARFLSRFHWYYPQRQPVGDGDVPPPSLDAAWAFFEHVTLARYYEDDDVDDDDDGNDEYRDTMKRAHPGETKHPTRLYGWWSTPEHQLADFGIGVGMYFTQLRVLAIICLIAGLINIPAILYYGSEEYSNVDTKNLRHRALLGSAICTNQTWAPCPECTASQWDTFPRTYTRFATSNDGLTFILRNQCTIGWQVGYANIASLIFITIAMLYTASAQHKRETVYDLNQQTASDYSIEVQNSPNDAYDPEEWKSFFSSFGHVTCCTVVLHNEALVKTLIKRRKLLQIFELALPKEVTMDKDKLAEIVASVPEMSCWEKHVSFWRKDVHSIYLMIQKLDKKIQGLIKDYGVSNVFITFETEEAQRSALHTLSVPTMAIWRNNKTILNKKHVFRGKTVLKVRESCEPDTIRWDELDVPLLTIIYQKIKSYTLLFIVLVVFATFIVEAKEKSPAASAITITVTNILTPMFVKAIDSMESHSDHTSKQLSMYLKIALCRFVNTVLITVIVTPFTDNIDDTKQKSLIYSVHAIFITEMVTQPIVQLTDIVGNIKKHFCAPRQKTQARMNRCFLGKKYILGERYTDMTKVIFLTFFYSMFYPMGFFFAFITLTIHYWTDKFLLLRLWQQQPQVGSEIAKFSRYYFFPIAIVYFAFASTYVWGSFPFDRACQLNALASDSYIGTHSIVDLANNTYNVTVDTWDHNFFFCDQELFKPFHLPPLNYEPRDVKWMSGVEYSISKLFGKISLFVLVIFSLVFLWHWTKKFRQIFMKTYQPDGYVVGPSFSESDGAYAYIPSTKVPFCQYPLLACHLGSDPVPGLIGWRDPYKSYDSWNLVNDVLPFADGTVKHLFSTFKHWPPEEK